MVHRGRQFCRPGNACPRGVFVRLAERHPEPTRFSTGGIDVLATRHAGASFCGRGDIRQIGSRYFDCIEPPTQGLDVHGCAHRRTRRATRCHVAVWTENSAGMGRCCPLEREIRAGNFSIMRQKARMSCGRTCLPRGFPDVPLVSSLPNVAATCVAEFSIQRQRHAEISHSKRQFLNLAAIATH